ncbi:MAG: class I SAM-dependent methyltransferase [Polyangiaceae bacterium]|nr:class I SAM-dependent methyltransferase [Polyangiaceae bacterium]
MSHSRRKARLTDWASVVAGTSAIAAAAAVALGKVPLAGACAAVCAGAILGARWSSQRGPSPMPYSLRWVLYLPRWPLSAHRLRVMLHPRPGERILELGPGVGIYSLPISAALRPTGVLEVLDIQAEMLATLQERARAAGAENIVATLGNAQRLPYADRSFDAAYVIGVLGELPDPDAALKEIGRVLKPGGRLVVGEALVIDPDGVRLTALREMAARAGFMFDRRLGPGAAYFAKFSSQAAAPTSITA